MRHTQPALRLVTDGMSSLPTAVRLIDDSSCPRNIPHHVRATTSSEPSVPAFASLTMRHLHIPSSLAFYQLAFLYTTYIPQETKLSTPRHRENINHVHTRFHPLQPLRHSHSLLFKICQIDVARQNNPFNYSQPNRVGSLVRLEEEMSSGSVWSSACELVWKAGVENARNDLSVEEEVIRKLKEDRRDRRDRKSTRLNSSHWE